MKLGTLFSTLAALVIVASLGTASGAAAGNKKITDLGKCDVTALEGATDCDGVFQKNGQPDAADFNKLAIFGISDWVQINKVDNKTGSEDGVLTVTKIGREKGEWSFTTSSSAYTTYMAVLKGGNFFTGFLLKGGLDDGIKRDWSVIGATTDTKDKSRDLSNFALYGSKITVIPLPAAGWLLVSVFGGLGVANHLRKRRAA